VSDFGLVGVLYRPEDATGVAPVMLLGGSEGGLHEDDAALLAAHGHAVLALAYYGLPGLPATLRDIPLEYFERALDYLEALPFADAERLTVIGGSKGGEAALLIGSRSPRVRAVVSMAGSGLLTQGIDQDVLTGSFLDIMKTPVATWTSRGEPLPFLPNVVTPELEARARDGEPISLRDAIGPAIAVTDLHDACAIPVERINGPVLLLVGEDDQGYGVAFHQVAADRLHANRHRHPWRHIVYPEAGHLIIVPPYRPTTDSTSPGPGVVFEHGGTPEADARARADVWRQILEFLA
jgi:dienelactone hydrolase